jgi:predicted TIM-barrel fold metal-dependent hydrolase
MTPESQAAPAPRSQPHDPHPRKPAVALPAGACDTHAHVFGPGERYPYFPGKVYTPADALPAEHRAMLDVLGVERAVLVQPSVYGLNNQALLDAVAERPDSLRGVVVLPLDAPVAQIESLHRQGVRGIRCNVVDLSAGKGQLELSALRRCAERIRPFGWHVEFLLHVHEHPQLDTLLADFPVPVVFGHLGYVLPAARGRADPGFRALLRLLRDGRAWVKMTAPYRLSTLPMPYADVGEFAAALLEAAPGRLLWGSDWPHVEPFPGGPTGAWRHVVRPMPNDGDLFDVFAGWVPDAAVRRTILVDNPADLYGFERP